MIFRKLMVLSAVGLAALVLPACNSGESGSVAPGTGTTAAAPVDVGGQLYLAEKPEMIPPPEIIEQTVVIPGAVIRMDKKQVVSAEVDGRLEIVGTPLPRDTVVDPNDKDIMYDPNANPYDPNRRKDAYRRLRIGDRVMKGQVVSLINDLDVLVQMEAAQAVKDASTKAIAEATKGAEMVEKTVQILENLGPSGSLTEKLNAQATLSRYRENIYTSERELAKSNGDEKRAMVLRSKHRSMAAVTGVIINILREPGEQVRAGEPIMEILSLSDVRIEGTMEAHYANFVKEGMTVVIEPTLPMGPDLKLGAISHRGVVTGVAVTPDPTRPLVVSASLDNTAIVWDLKATSGGRSQTRLPHPVGVRSVAVTGAKAPKPIAATGGDDGRIRLWDLSNPASISDRPMQEFAEAQASGVVALCFSPDGRHLASAAGRDIWIWDVSTGKKLYSLPGEHRDSVTTVKFTPQAKLVTASRDKTVRIWTLGDKGANVERTIDHRKANVDALGVSSGGGRVLFDQDDGRLEIVSLADGQSIGSIINATAGARFAGVSIFSPDDSYVLTAGGDADMRGELQVWETPKPGGRGAEVRRLVTPRRAMPTCADFGAGFVAVGNEAGGVHVWTAELLKGNGKVRTGRVVSVLRADARNVKVRVETSATDGEFGLLQDKSTATLIIHPGQTPPPQKPIAANVTAPLPNGVIPAGGVILPRVDLPQD